MKRSGRLRRVFAGFAVMGILGGGITALAETPAFAAWPATIKICNSTSSEDTNGGGTDGKNIDVDRLPGSSYGTYSNELLPGDCTGNVNDPANVRIDATDDGANYSAAGSFQVGIDQDGIDDGQSTYDPACANTASISNENAYPVPQTAAEHVVAGYGLEVRLQTRTSCGADDPNFGRICSDSGSYDDFDAEGIGTNTYNNNLPPGECTAFFPVAAAGTEGTENEYEANRMLADLSDDNSAGETVAYKWKDNYQQTTLTHCEQTFSTELGGTSGTGWDVPVQHDPTTGALVAGKTVTIKTFLGNQDPDEGICGLEAPVVSSFVDESAYGKATDTDYAEGQGTDPGDSLPTEQVTWPYQTTTTEPLGEPDGS